MIAHIRGNVDNEMLEKFIQMYNTESSEYIVYFSSAGGSCDTANAIVHLINKNAEKTTIICYWQILSAGFKIFYESKCKREITENSIGMWHLGMSDLTIDDSGKMPYIQDVLILKRNKTIGYNNTLELALKLGFNDAEIKRLKKGKDVYLLADRLNKFLESQKEPINII